MTARQQIARLLPLVFLVILAAAGLRGRVLSPRWDGPLKSDGVAISLALEVVLGTLLAITVRRDNAARRAAVRQPYTGEAADLELSAVLRFALKWLLGGGMAAVAVVLITDLHLHFFRQTTSAQQPPSSRRKQTFPTLPSSHGGGGSLHIPWGPILYGLLVVALVAAVAISIWWSSRLRRPAAPLVIVDTSAEDLREAVESGRAALAELDDARAAIIACYVAMERTLAERGTARTVADTPDELLARAVARGTVRGPAAGRLTALFYEARFSTHPLEAGQRASAAAALDELAAELTAAEAAKAAAAAAAETAAAAAAETAAAAAAETAAAARSATSATSATSTPPGGRRGSV